MGSQTAGESAVWQVGGERRHPEDSRGELTWEGHAEMSQEWDTHRQRSALKPEWLQSVRNNPEVVDQHR